jgi:putative hydrolase of the HAD superfamily
VPHWSWTSSAGPLLPIRKLVRAWSSAAGACTSRFGNCNDGSTAFSNSSRLRDRIVEFMPLLFPLSPVVFFDAVGTLLHPEPPASAVYAAVGRRFGSRLDEASIRVRFRAAFRRQEEADYANNLRTDEAREVARWRAIVGEVLDDVTDVEACFRELYDHFARADAWRCEPEAAEVFAELAARGHVLGIASNFDHRLRSLVEQLHAFGPIRHLVISSEIGWRKPARAFFEAMCRRAACSPGQILYVGDDPVNDYDGARAAGLQTVLLAPDALTSPADARIKSLSDLLDRNSAL